MRPEIEKIRTRNRANFAVKQMDFNARVATFISVTRKVFDFKKDDILEANEEMDGGGRAIYFPWFNIVRDAPTSKCVMLSFRVDCELKQVSEVSLIASRVFEGYDFIVGNDFYYDFEERKMVFGREAEEKYQDHLASRDGFKRCPVCNLFHKRVDLGEKGVCETCEVDLATMRWS